MIFILIEKQDLVDFRTEFISYDGSNIVEIKNNITNNHYTVIKTSERFEDIRYFISSKKIRANFLIPLLSGPSFSSIYGLEILHRFKILPVSYTAKPFLEDVISDTLEQYPKHDGQYINLFDLEPHNKTTIEMLEKANSDLINENLFIFPVQTKTSLEEVFGRAIQEVIKGEIKNLDVNNLKQMEENNKEFYTQVIAEFILMANRYYNKPEIYNFLNERL